MPKEEDSPPDTENIDGLGHSVNNAWALPIGRTLDDRIEEVLEETNLCHKVGSGIEIEGGNESPLTDHAEFNT